ncbi:ARH38 factor, partial [Acrocephalus arundinaceus]|nr:ARH38 factor [Acrocephalus arundinaceus]
VKDRTFNKEEKLFQSLEKTVKLCVKNISLCSQHLQVGTGFFAAYGHKPLTITSLVYTFQMAQLDKLVLTPLSALQALFPGPQKLIQKRYDKLLDYNSCLQRSAGEELDLAKKDYEALNAQLVEELQVFNRAAKKIVFNCLHCFITLLGNIMFEALQSNPAVVVPIPNQLIEEVHKLNFVKENSSVTFMEKKLSLEKKKPVPSPLESPRQTEEHRSKLLSTYNTESLYQAKRKCNAAQEFDIDLHEGELVAVVEQKDPFGSTSRWLVDTGILTGYVYSSFLRSYNPAKAQKDLRSNMWVHFSILICVYVAFLFQIFYAVYAFQARSDQELSLQEYQRVRILRFSDLSGNKEWWLAEAKGQKGYVPSNYLGKMTYA